MTTGRSEEFTAPESGDRSLDGGWGERLRHALAALLFVGLSLLYLRPIWRVFGTHIAPDLGDPLFNLVILKWGVHKLSGGLAGFWSTFWNAPFYFPARDVTTLSDHLLGPAAFATLLGRFGVGAIAAYNLLFLGSFVLSGFATYWVLRRAGRSEVAAFLGGMAFAFAPFRWDQASHLQILLTPWIPLVLWHFDRLLVEGTGRRAGWFLLFYTLHVTGGAYLAYMIHVPLAVLFLNRLAGPGRIEWNGARARILGLTAGFALAVAGMVFAPYVLVRQAIERRGADARLYGASLVSWLTPAVRNLYSGAFSPLWRRPENAFFPGFLPSALALFAIGAEVRRRKRAEEKGLVAPQSASRRLALGALLALAAVAYAISDLRTWLDAPQVKASGFAVSTLPYLTAFAIVILALGTYALLRRRWEGRRRAPLFAESAWDRGLVYSGVACAVFALPLAYVPLMAILPGFSGMRVESRFLVLAALPVAALAAQGFDLALAWLRTSHKRKLGRPTRIAIAAATLGLLAFELCPHPLNWCPLPPEPELPPVYRFLAGDPKVAAVLELPIHAPLDDLPYLYFGTFHHKPLVNGYSGFVPPENQAFRADCCWPVPDAARLALLQNWGVTHVVVHLDRLEGRWQRREAKRWNRSAAVRRVYQDDRTIVFALLPESRGAVRAATIKPR